MTATPVSPSSPSDTGALVGPPRVREIVESLSRLHDLVVVCDGEDRIAWWSDRLGVVAGDAADLVGARFADVVRGAADLTDLRTQVASPLGVGAGRIELEGSDGDALEVSAFRLATDRDLTVLVGRTTEEARRAAACLRGNAAYLAAVLDCAPDAVIATDRGGFVSYANPAAAALFHTRADALEGHPLASCLPCTAGLAAVLDGVRGEAVTGQDLEIVDASGRRYVSVSTSELRLPSGEVAGNVVFVRDVSKRRLAEIRLAEKAEELEQYVSHVSHDLRSPLSSLLGFASLLRREPLGARGESFLDRIEQSGRTMETLITDLLELSRIGSSNEPAEWVAPLPILEQIAAEWKSRFEERGIELDLPGDAPLVFCHRTRLYQLFSNLLGNAIAHMGTRDGARVCVAIDEEPHAHHLRVVDNGRGIAREHHERIFDVFATLGRRADGAKSTGIGLAIVRRIAIAHGGRAWVESEPGCGSAFHVTIARPARS